MVLYLTNLGASAVLVGLLDNQRSFEGAIIQPVVGAWSDRTWTRLGRRRPFVVAFVPLCVLFLFLTPILAPEAKQAVTSPHFSVPLLLAGISIFLFSVTFNTMYDPYNALLADITPEKQRGSVNGIFQALGAAGQVAILIAATLLVPAFGYGPMFWIVAATLALSFIPTIVGIREPRRLPGVTKVHKYSVRDYWDGLRTDRQIQLYFAVQFFLWFGIAAITPFLTLFAKREMHFSDTQAFTLPLTILLTTALACSPLGALADRIGLKRMFLIGMICLAGASIAGIFVRDPVLIYVVVAVAGFGNAAQTASSYPLLTRLVFADKIGLYTGLNSTVTSIAAPLAGVIAGALIDAYGTNALFPCVAATFLLSLLPLAFLRRDQSVVAKARAAESAAA
jgi:maltose/moltooligosaccharide transporter